MAITFFVEGVPGPQGSKRIGRNRRTGKAQLIESSAKVKPWREAIAWEAMKHPKISGKVKVHIDFYLPRPASRPNEIYCGTKPDADKLERSTLDGLKDGGVIDDDARVVMLSSTKYYANGKTGAQITIESVVDIGELAAEMAVQADRRAGLSFQKPRPWSFGIRVLRWRYDARH